MTSGPRLKRGGRSIPTGDSPDRSANGPRAVAREITEPVRLNRYLAQAGVAARRKADEIIAAGHVTINGTAVTELGSMVQPGDKVEVSGRLVSPSGHLYILLNKPEDTITTTSDERGRTSVLDLVAIDEEQKAALFPVGRLDRNTVGVLLLTTDGDLAHRLTHPSYEVEKLYLVETAESVKPHELALLRQGVMLDDGEAKADMATYTSEHHREIGLSIHEGRNRIVRRMIEAIGHEVVRLERVRYGGLTTEGVRRGKWRRLSPIEVRRLRRIVGLK